MALSLWDSRPERCERCTRARTPRCSGWLVLCLVTTLGCVPEDPAPSTRLVDPSVCLEPRHVLDLSPAGDPITFHPRSDPPILLTRDLDRSLLLWDIRSGKRLGTLAAEGWEVSRRLSFSPEGQLVAGFSPDGIGLWDVGRRKPARTIAVDLENMRCSCMVFSPDGKAIATDGERVRLWNLATGKVRWDNPSPASAVVFSPNGGQLATYGLGLDDEAIVQVWAVATGRLVHTLRAPGKGRIYQVAFSPDGKVIASDQSHSKSRHRAGKGAIDLWDSASGRHLARLEGHTHIIRGLAFRPDGRWLASACQGGTVRLWDLAEGRLGHTLRLEGQGGSVAFSPDGRWLAASEANISPDGRKLAGHPDLFVSIWDLAPAVTK